MVLVRSMTSLLVVYSSIQSLFRIIRNPLTGLLRMYSRLAGPSSSPDIPSAASVLDSWGLTEGERKSRLELGKIELFFELAGGVSVVDLTDVPINSVSFGLFCHPFFCHLLSM